MWQESEHSPAQQDPRDSGARHRPRRTGRLAAVAAGAVTVFVWVIVESRPQPLAERVEFAAVEVSDARGCASCHPHQVKTSLESPHLRTLARANEDDTLGRLVGERLSDPASSTWFEYSERDAHFWVASPGYADGRPVRLDWRVGSGRHSRAYVTLLADAAGNTDLLEHRLSWYSDDDTWDLTLGHPEQPTAGVGVLGLIHPHTAALSCFGCHAAAVPVENGQIRTERIVPGVRCDRCHREATQHAAAMQGGRIEHEIERLGDLPPLESVNRCGECHRRADQLAADELVPTNPQLLRFAVAALLQSTCFNNSSSGRPFTCLTCHNPHEPAETDPLWYSDRCANCHAGRASGARRCAVQPAATDCLGCHMPKLPVASHLKFTDHWIRVRGGVSDQR